MLCSAWPPNTFTVRLNVSERRQCQVRPFKTSDHRAVNLPPPSNDVRPSDIDPRQSIGMTTFWYFYLMMLRQVFIHSDVTSPCPVACNSLRPPQLGTSTPYNLCKCHITVILECIYQEPLNKPYCGLIL